MIQYQLRIRQEGRKAITIRVMFRLAEDRPLIQIAKIYATDFFWRRLLLPVFQDALRGRFTVRLGDSKEEISSAEYLRTLV